MILMLTGCTKIAIDTSESNVVLNAKFDIGVIIYNALMEFLQSPMQIICLIIITGSLMSIAGSLATLSRSYKQISKNTSNAESVMKFMQNR